LKLIETINQYSVDFNRILVDFLEAGYSLRLTAQGTSMSPLIREGDVVLIDPIGSQLPKPSEVVFFINHQGNLVLHRVIKRMRKNRMFFFLLKGDQVANTDGFYEEDRIIGRLRGFERNGNTLSMKDMPFKMLNYLAFLRSLTGFGSRGILTAPLLKSRIFSKYLDY